MNSNRVLLRCGWTPLEVNCETSRSKVYTTVREDFSFSFDLKIFSLVLGKILIFQIKVENWNQSTNCQTRASLVPSKWDYIRVSNILGNFFCWNLSQATGELLFQWIKFAFSSIKRFFCQSWQNKAFRETMRLLKNEHLMSDPIGNANQSSSSSDTHKLINYNY